MIDIANFITPLLLLDRRVLADNIRTMANHLRRRNLRPHFKTAKMIEVAQQQIEAGASGFTCATVGEIDALLAAGVTDIFWAHQPVGEKKIAAVLDFNRRGSVKVAIDSLAVARPLAQAAAQNGLTIPYLIEINSGLGRAGIASGNWQQLVQLVHDLTAVPGLQFTGIFTHEGQLYQIKSSSQRDEQGRKIGRDLVELADRLAAARFLCPTISVGSTPGANSVPLVEGISEARPGTYVFNDANQCYLGVASQENCAVQVISRVVSRPRPQTAIIDAGLKAMSSDRSLSGNNYGNVSNYREIFFTAAYEEHGVLTGPGVELLEVGDVVAIVPNHVCGTVNMWSEALISDGQSIIDCWRIVARH